MIDLRDLRRWVIFPALYSMDLYSQSAENLLVGTYLVEGLVGPVTHLTQLDRGPARGIYQMEPESFATVQRWVAAKRRRIVGIWSPHADPFAGADKLISGRSAQDLIWDMRLATVAARIHYYRDPMGLPAQDDIPGLAAYWKRVWNTPAGKGDPRQFIARYRALAMGG